MAAQYDDMQGTPMEVEDHSSYNMKEPTQRYAGDVIPAQTMFALKAIANKIERISSPPKPENAPSAKIIQFPSQK